MRSALLAVLLFLAVLAGCSTPPPEIAVVGEDDVLERLRAVRRVEAGDGPREARPLAAPKYEIAFDRRNALFQNAPSTLEIPDVPSGPAARFQVAPALSPGAWARSDGARFEVLCRAPDTSDGAADAADGPATWRTLLELSIDPARPADRVWHERTLSLAPCSSPTTALRLRVDCGEAEDCAADWTIWGTPRITYPATWRPPARRLVVLISIDTLRADHLGLHGASRPTSPHLDRLAEEAIVFEDTLATSPWTIPSHASLFTSTAPQVHGADFTVPIPADLPILAEVFRDAGWRTGGFIDTASLGERHGFARGFEHWEHERMPGSEDPRRGARRVGRSVVRWLGAESGDDGARPTFLFWHLMDVHGPYGVAAPVGGRFRRAARAAAPERAEGDDRLAGLHSYAHHDYLRLDRFQSFDELVAAYDEGIAEVDEVLGDFFDLLRRAGAWDDALVVVTSDHGESLLDHGVFVGHSLFLSEAELRVPLLIKLPGGRHGGTRVAGPVSLTEIAPTLLDAARLDAPSSFSGHSLISPSPGHPRATPRAVFAHSTHTGASAVRTLERKYISAALPGAEDVLRNILRPVDGASIEAAEALLAEQAYDLKRDPAETSARQAASDPAFETLRRGLLKHVATCLKRREELGPEEDLVLDQEIWEQLRALGYVQ